MKPTKSLASSLIIIGYLLIGAALFAKTPTPTASPAAGSAPQPTATATPPRPVPRINLQPSTQQFIRPVTTPTPDPVLVNAARLAAQSNSAANILVNAAKALDDPQLAAKFDPKDIKRIQEAAKALQK
jgi:hypothetical protein